MRRTRCCSPAFTAALTATLFSVGSIVALVTAPAGASAPGPRTYRPPVTAPVADPFRAPPAPWLAGNRGIEYQTLPGTPVRAIGPGVVSFAGRVAGELDVTVTHPDGLRSSYVDLAVAHVDRGADVAAGDIIGLSTDRLHLGVRRGDRYLDPASLWGKRVSGGRVVLVPTEAQRHRRVRQRHRNVRGQRLVARPWGPDVLLATIVGRPTDR